jgi:hypothetical protein
MRLCLLILVCRLVLILYHHSCLVFSKSDCVLEACLSIVGMFGAFSLKDQKFILHAVSPQ